MGALNKNKGIESYGFSSLFGQMVFIYATSND